MNWNAIIGVAASFSFFLPVAAIIYYKLYHHRSLIALVISCLITAFANLTSENIIPVSITFQKSITLINNYLDVPLMLTALLFFFPIKKKQRNVRLVTIAFIVYEIVIAIIYKLQPESITYIMGPGLVLVLIYSFYLFSRHIKVAIEFGKNAGRTLMIGSILFSYGCYGFVYYFFYIQKTIYVADAMLLYFISSLVYSIVLTIGLHLTRKRIKELQDVKKTRRELAMFFGN